MINRNGLFVVCSVLVAFSAYFAAAGSKTLTRAEMETAYGACPVGDGEECDALVWHSCGDPGDGCAHCQTQGRFGWHCWSPKYVIHDESYELCYCFVGGVGRECEHAGWKTCGIEFECEPASDVVGYYCSGGDCYEGEPNDTCRPCERGDATGQYDQKAWYRCKDV